MASTKAKVVWSEGLRFDGTATSGHEVVLDSSLAVGGTNAGFRPMELILLGLAGCTAMDVISLLQKKRQAVGGFEVRVTGTRADEHPRVYTDAHIEYIVRGHNIQPQALERSIELSETKYCPAQAMLRQSMHITHSYRIIEAGS
jgi:putative redox protein